MDAAFGGCIHVVPAHVADEACIIALDSVPHTDVEEGAVVVLEDKGEVVAEVGDEQLHAGLVVELARVEAAKVWVSGTCENAGGEEHGRV